MFKKVLLALVCITLFACKGEKPSITFIQSTSDLVILAGYAQLRESSALLYEHTTLCEQQGPDYRTILEKSKPYWHNVMSDWQQIQWVQFGPIKTDSREWALQFWPDRKNLVGRKTNALLKQDHIVSEQQLTDSSVLVQGLSALEFLLFDENIIDNNNDSKNRCHLVKEITKKLRSTTHDLYSDWKVFHQTNFSYPKEEASSAEVATVEQGINLLISNMVVQLDRVIDQKIATPFAIDKPANKRNAYFLESWRSESSRENIRSNIMSINFIFHKGGLKHYLNKKDHKVLVKKLDEEIRTTLELIDTERTEVSSSYFRLLSENKENAYSDVRSLYAQLSRLRVLIKTDLTQALGVKLGFNSNDGDS